MSKLYGYITHALINCLVLNGTSIMRALVTRGVCGQETSATLHAGINFTKGKLKQLASWDPKLCSID